MPSRTYSELIHDSVGHGDGCTPAPTKGQQTDVLHNATTTPEEKSCALQHSGSFGKRWASEECVLDTLLTSDDGASSILSISALPEELLLMIFSYLSFSENIDILQNVCMRWRELARDAVLWSDLEYVIREDTSDKEAVKLFKSAPQLRMVIMERVVQPCVFEALYRNCHNLTTLDISYQQLLTYEEARELFSECNEIRVLRMSERGPRADERFSEAVSQLPQLQVLQMKRYGGYEEGHPLRLGALAQKCPRLCDLDLGWLPYRLHDLQVFLSAAKHPLDHLAVGWTSLERRCIVPLLAACSDSLRRLELHTFDVDVEEAGSAFSALGQLRNLRELVLETVDGRRHRGLQNRLPYFIPLAFQSGGLSKLQLLCLWRIWDLGDKVLTAVSVGCPELRELSLEACWGHTDAAFAQLHLLKNLEIFTLSSCDCLGGDALRYIAQLPAVQTLCFSYINFQKLPGVESLLTMTKLRSIYLHESNCWSLPFSKFPGKLINLGALHIDYCNGDESELDRMCVKMPELYVEGKFEALFGDSEDDDC